MRFSFSFFVIAFLALSFGTHVSAQTSAQNIFTTNLSLGSRGTQVIALQRILNQSLDTYVTSTGPGSPRNETNYFGLLTKMAVVRFQAKYASEILAPVGLTQGNGYVGFYTRAKLNTLSTATIAVENTSQSIPSVVTSPSAPISQNPNLKNIDVFLTTIDTVAAQKGLSATARATIKQQVMNDIATTTDLHATFLKLVQDKSPQAIQDNSYTGGEVFAALKQAFKSIFTPKRAYAAVAGTPFGGALLYSFYCTQSQTWLITLTPLPPSYAALLTYVPSSQAYLSYNIPATPWLLGFYQPGAGVCIAGFCPYCVTIPSEGMITPVVGSAPL